MIRRYWAYRKFMYSVDLQFSLGNDYEKIKNESIAIWGAGIIGKKLVEALNYYGIRHLTVIDNNSEKFGNRILDYQIKPAAALAGFCGIVVIAVVKDDGIIDQIDRINSDGIKVYRIMDFLEYILGD
jgi:hypothetical protein